MAKALVEAITGVTPEQFRTAWSQFMKQSYSMNRLVCPVTLSIEKSDNKLNILPAMPDLIVSKAGLTGTVYIGIFVKNDDNAWEGDVLMPKPQDFSVNSSLTPGNWKELSVAQPITIVGAKFTAGKKYDVTIVVSDDEINVETAENSWDRPYSVKGKACEMIFEVTAQA